MTTEELETNLKNNLDDYGAMISIAALYTKLYGKLPKIGMSGAQGEYADSLILELPEPNNS